MLCWLGIGLSFLVAEALFKFFTTYTVVYSCCPWFSQHAFLLSMVILLGEVDWEMRSCFLQEPLLTIFEVIAGAILANVILIYGWIPGSNLLAYIVTKSHEFLEEHKMGYILNNFIITTEFKGGYFNLFDFAAFVILIAALVRRLRFHFESLPWPRWIPKRYTTTRRNRARYCDCPPGWHDT